MSALSPFLLHNLFPMREAHRIINNIWELRFESNGVETRFCPNLITIASYAGGKDDSTNYKKGDFPHLSCSLIFLRIEILTQYN